MTHAAVYHTVRTVLQQLAPQFLGCLVSVRRVAGLITFTDVVEPPAEVGEVCAFLNEGLEYADLRQFGRPVEDDLRVGRLDRQSRVPRHPTRAVEPPARG